MVSDKAQSRHTKSGTATNRIFAYGLIFSSDVIAIVSGYLLANLIYIGTSEFNHAASMILVIVPIFFWDAMINQAYGARVLYNSSAGFVKAVRALVIAASVLLIILYSLQIGFRFSRVVFWLGLAFSSVFIIIGRRIAGQLIFRMFDGVPFRTIVLMDDVELALADGDIAIDVSELGFDPATTDPHSYHDFSARLAQADRVLVACVEERAGAWARVLKSMAVDGEVVGPEFDRLGAIGVNRYHGRQTIVVSAGPLHLRERIQKRIFDIVVSGVAIVVLAPLFAIVAIAIRLESPGPVFFRQQRIGRDNRLFDMYKFRSMYAEKTDHSASKLTERNDARVTRVGAFIRRNSIDELPQLFNVLSGEMSIVGPRPHALSARAAQELYWDIDDRYRHRHVVKPGVTGLAQIRGYRGATVERSDLINRLSSDLEYVHDWSLGRDVWILFRTALVIRHENAF